MTTRSGNDLVDSVANATEATLLLSSEEPALSSSVTPHWFSTDIRYRVVFLALTTSFTYVFGSSLLQAPLTALLEWRICNDLYPDVVESGQDCKNPAVQGELASLLGWITMLECFPGLVAAIPYGVLSDSWGRHRVLALALLGEVLANSYVLAAIYFSNIIPFRLALIYPLFSLIGGGSGVINAMWFNIIADVMPVNERTTIYLQMSSINLIASVVAGPLAGAVMLNFGPWAGYILALSFVILSWPLSLFFPDTLRLAPARKVVQGGVDLEDEAFPTGGRSYEEVSSPTQRIISKMLEGLADARQFISSHQHVVILTVCFLFEFLGGLVGMLLLQYVTKKFDWSWGKATIILTTRTVSSLIFLSLIVPALGQLMVTRLKLSLLFKDIWIARVSGIFGVSGALIVAYANTPAVLIIGLIVLSINSACPVVLRSIIIALIEPQYMATVNSLIDMLSLLGTMAVSPLLYGSFRVGVQWGEPWLGLPFICAAGFLSISNAIIWLLPIRKVNRE